MNSAQAKQVLLAYRPGSSDEADPEVKQALALVRQDGELQGWLQHQLAFQKSVQSELCGIVVPSGLKARILAQQRVVVVPFWRRPEWLLVAACLVLGLIVSALWIIRPREQHTFTAFRSRMVAFAVRQYRMDIVTNDLREITAYLRQHGTPTEYSLNAPLRALPAVGGASLRWQGHPVSMVCFGLPKNQTLFMFIMDKGAVADGVLPGPSPRLEPVKGMLTASWNKDGKVYLVAAADPTPVERVSKGVVQ